LPPTHTDKDRTICFDRRTFAGRDDRRLPTLAELETLLDRTRGRFDCRAVMREEVPFKNALPYWSSTTFEQDTKTAWILMFDGAYLLSYYKTNRYQVRCVRGKRPEDKK